jgi:hypothetical protein
MVSRRVAWPDREHRGDEHHPSRDYPPRHDSGEGEVMRIRLTRIALAIALLPAALLIPACGGNDSGGESAAPPSTPEGVDIPRDADALKQQCVEELVSAGQSEADAAKTCTVPDDEDIDSAVDDAVESCLEIADELPAGDVREQAKQDCRTSAE